MRFWMYDKKTIAQIIKRFIKKKLMISLNRWKLCMQNLSQSQTPIESLI